MNCKDSWRSSRRPFCCSRQKKLQSLEFFEIQEINSGLSRWLLPYATWPIYQARFTGFWNGELNKIQVGVLYFRLERLFWHNI
jgi:hypothetical protein